MTAVLMRLSALLALLVLAAPAPASVDSGVAKWRAGDWSGAVRDWQKPAQRGDPEAMFNLGQAYLLGRGTLQNRDTAIDLFRRASARGHRGATASLGIALWQDGRRTEALQYLRTAADKGELRAAYVLGVAMFSGDGLPRNKVLGYAYIVRARDGGLTIARDQAGHFATRLTTDERARAEATARALASGQPVEVALFPADNAPAGTMSAKTSSAKTTAEAATPVTPPATPAGEDAGPPEAVAEGFRVQLGAYSSTRTARSAWAALVAQQADLLKGLKPSYVPRGNLVRLQVGPFADRPAARDLCQKLASAGRPCFVTQ